MVAVQIISVDEMVSSRGETVFTVRYRLTLDGVVVSARVEQQLAPAAMTAAMAGVTSAQGRPLTTVVTAGMTLEAAAMLHTLMLNRVVEIGGQAAVEAAIVKALIASVHKSKSISEDQVTVKMMRHRESLTTTGESVWELQYVARMSGVSVSPLVSAPLDAARLAAELPAPAAGDPYAWLRDQLDLVLYGRLASLTLATAAVQSDFAALQTALGVAFVQSTEYTSSNQIAVTIRKVEETIDAATRVSYYKVSYSVTVDGVLLDESYEVSASAAAVVNALDAAAIRGPAGVYALVSTAAMEVLRVERSETLLVQGLVSAADLTKMAAAMQAVVRAAGSEYATATVKVAQQIEVLSVTGQVFTELRAFVEVDGRAVLPGMLAPVVPATVTAELARLSVTRAESYTVADASAVAVVDARFLLFFSLSVAVTASDAKLCNEKLATMLKQRSEFSSSTVVTEIITQRELFILNGGTAWHIGVSVTVDGAVFDMRHLSVVTSAELSSVLRQVTVTGSSGTYDDYVYTLTGTEMRVDELGFFTFDQMVAASQFEAFAAAIKLALTAMSSEYSAFEVRVVKQLSFTTGEGLLVWRLLFSMTSAGQWVRGVDVSAISGAAILAQLKAAQLLTATGSEFSVVAGAGATLVRTADLFSDVVLRQRVDAANVAEFEAAAAGAYLTILQAIHGSEYKPTVTYRIMKQQELVVKMSGTTQTTFQLLAAIYVDGQLVMARTAAALSAAAVATATASIKVQGSELTFADLSVEMSATSIVYESMFSLALKVRVKSADVAALEAAIAVEVKKQLGLSSQTVNVTVVKQETVMKDGKSVVKLSYSVTVDGELVDARAVNVDMTAVATAVVSLAVVDASVSDTTGLRFELSQKVCVSNELTEADVTAVMELVKKTYVAMSSGDTIQYSRTKLLVTSKNRRVHCVHYDVLTAAGVQVATSYDLTALRTQFSGQLDSSGVVFSLVFASADVRFMSLDSAFYFYLKAYKVRRADMDAVTTKLTALWRTYRPDLTDLSITFLQQFDAYLQNGEHAARFSYVVLSGGVSLDAQVETGLSLAALVAGLRDVSVSGAAGVQYGGLVLSEADLVGVVLKTDLCHVVVREPLLAAHRAAFGAALQLTWRQLGRAGVTVAVVAEQEVVVRYSYAAYMLLYKASSADASSSALCLGYDDAFRAAMPAVMTARGAPYTLQPATAARSKRLAFSFFSQVAVSAEHQEAVSAALVSALTGVITTTEQLSVKIGLQQEFVTVTGQMMWRIFYFVLAGDVAVDAQTEVGLTAAAVRTALTAVVTGDAAVSYGSLVLVDLTPAGLYDYRMRFTIDLATPVKRTDWPAFGAVITSVWSASASMTFKIITLDEVIDSNGMSAFQLVYFALRSGTVVDARSVAAITAAQYRLTPAFQTLPQGPRGPYVAHTTLVAPLRRAAFSMLLYVEQAVPVAHVELFRAALEVQWRLTLPDVKVVFGIQEDYTRGKLFVTGLRYFLEQDGILVSPASLPALDVAALGAALSFEWSAGQAYVLLDPASVPLYRYSLAFGAFCRRALPHSARDAVLTNLLQAWRSVLGSGVTIAGGSQEEVVDAAGRLSWRLVYFVASTGADAAVLDARLLSPLSAAKLAAAYHIAIAGAPTRFYSDDLLADGTLADLLRVRELFTVNLKQKAAPPAFPNFERSIRAAWAATDSDFSSVVISVLQQQMMVTLNGEFIWVLYYAATLDGRQLSRLKVTTDVSVALTIEVAKLKTARDQFYAVDERDTALRRYDSAFYAFLTRPVATVDNDDVIAKLAVVWKAFRADLVASLTVTFTRQEEFIAADGKSVYKFAYFVSAASGLVDALFEDGLSIADVTTAFDVTVTGAAVKFSAFLFDGDVSTLVNYSDLLRVAFVQPVARGDYPAIEEAIQRARAKESKYAGIAIKIRTQEEYLGPKGEIYSVLLYTTTLNDVVLAVDDLPQLAAAALSAIEAMVAPSGDQYELFGDLSKLRRYKLAMWFFVDRWVSRVDVATVTQAVLTVVKQSKSDGAAALKVELGAQEPHDNNGVQTVKFVFFLLSGDRHLDGALEAPVSPAALSEILGDLADKYKVLASSAAAGARNMRLSLTLHVAGRVRQHLKADFEATLLSAWKTVDSAITKVEIASIVEHVGKAGAPVSGLSYFVFAGTELLDGRTLRLPSELATRVRLPAGDAWTVYRGDVARYTHLYSMTTLGETSPTEAAQILDKVKATWTLGGLVLKLVNLEQAFGKFGAPVTHVLYLASVDGVPTFPENDAVPDVLATIAGELDGVKLYAGETLRLAELFHVTVSGEMTKTVGLSLQAAINDAWKATADYSEAFCSLVGMNKRQPTAPNASLKVHRVFYKVVASDGQVVAVASVRAEPTVTPPTPLLAFGGATRRLRSMVLKARLSASQLDGGFKVAVGKAWQQSTGLTSAFTVLTESQQRYVSVSSKLVVNKLTYSVTADGAASDAAFEAPGSVELTSQLDAVSVSAPCGCVAKRNYRIYLRTTDADIGASQAKIRASIKAAWADANKDIETTFEVTMSVPSSRAKRSIGDNTTYTDENGVALTPADYQVSVSAAGDDPDALFTSPPTTAELNAQLTDGIEECGCQPDLCGRSVTLQGEVTALAKVTGAIRAAYLDANPDMTADQVKVENVETTAQLDGEKNALTKVTYCIVTTATLADLNEPSAAQMVKALADAGFDMVAAQGEEEKDKKYIIIIIAVCSVAAFILVVLAFVKIVCCSRRSQGEDGRPGYNGVDEENFPSHGTYGTGAFNSMGKGSYDSRTQLYANRLSS